MNFFLKVFVKTFNEYQFILLLLINYAYNFIILPFNSTHFELNLNEKLNKINPVEYLLSEISKNQLYSAISIGNPPKNLEFYLTMDSFIYSILSGYCPNNSFSSYNPYLSKNFKTETDYIISVGIINNAAIGTDNCTFYNDLNLSNNIYIDNFEFLLGNYSFFESINKNKYCGRIGLYKSNIKTYAYAKNFIKYLNEEKIIDSYSWGLFFFDKDKSYNIDYNIQNNYEGFYIVGIKEDDYFNIFNTTNIISVNSIENNIFFKVFFYESPNNKTEIICSDNIIAHFIVDYNYILSGKEYYENILKFFFQKYIDNRICFIKSSFKTYEGKTEMIVCDISFKKYLNYFPTIYFHNRDFYFTFNLDYNDLFLESNDKIYFLIVYKDMIQSTWQFGKMFMRKYPFIFDQDKKTVSFVYLNKFIKKEEEIIKGNNNHFKKIKDYFLISLLFIGILIGLFLGRRIWNKHRKLKANELEEKFEYISQNSNSKIID